MLNAIYYKLAKKDLYCKSIFYSHGKELKFPKLKPAAKDK